MGWVLFRAESLELAGRYYQVLFNWQSGAWSFSNQFWFTFTLAALISFVPAVGKVSYSLNHIYYNQMNLLAKGAGSMLILVACFSEVAVSGFHPFIYFRF